MRPSAEQELHLQALREARIEFDQQRAEAKQLVDRAAAARREAILRARSSDLICREIADALGVSRQHVYRIVHGEDDRQHG